MFWRLLYVAICMQILIQKDPFVRYYPKNLDTSGQMGLNNLRLLQPLHINILQRRSIVAMVAHKAAFNAGEVERLVILVVVILGAEVFIPVAGHILLEESYKVFEEFEAVLSQFIAELAVGDDDTPVGVVAYALAILPEADIDIQTSLVNTDADAICIPHNTARISVTKSLA